MKQWNSDELILFYYGELNRQQNIEIREALANSPELQKSYAAMCEFLDNKVELAVPEIEQSLNQRIMAGVYQQIENESRTDSNYEDVKGSLFTSWWSSGFIGKLAGASAIMSVLVISTFFVGRWSSQVEQNNQIAESTPNSVSSPNTSSIPMANNSPNDRTDVAQFSPRESERVFFSNVSQHLEIGGRVLQMVSNGNGDLAEKVAERKQTIDELVALNRLYRRLAEQSGDIQLVGLLQQMERMFIELNHTDTTTKATDFENIRERLEQSDLLYQLKITDKKIEQKLI